MDHHSPIFQTAMNLEFKKSRHRIWWENAGWLAIMMCPRACFTLTDKEADLWLAVEGHITALLPVNLERSFFLGNQFSTPSEGDWETRGGEYWSCGFRKRNADALSFRVTMVALCLALPANLCAVTSVFKGGKPYSLSPDFHTLKFTRNLSVLLRTRTW